ncbi:glycine oxidase ThiO [Phyllobacterium sp. YR531]|uniref:glycine oxidase ThiO n=1 Tax=Phyllobacterium sp. YR531 TaxID=1144343 RepID=UPI00026F86FD|nr:glycine oxidase ThiO [Phyllobacterium sp. YR531]EJN04019.1 glycine oxidase ThiO [Phyllobacterium sp. YR531]
MANVLVKGAGVAGLTVAYELRMRGAEVTIVDPCENGNSTASWYAGGMLAPWCERESAEQAIVDLGLSAADWWEEVLPGLVTRKGTLVIAPARDVKELDRFAARTSGFVRIGEEAISLLEPDLNGLFRKGLFFEREAHLTPRRVLTELKAVLAALGVQFETEISATKTSDFEWIINCTGMAAADPALRGVRGEMLLLRSKDIALSRPLRLIHPRFPLYVVPRSDHIFMVGATMIESDASGPVTARSVMELLNAAYSVHPAFGEAEVIETGVGVRPAYPDNLPRVVKTENHISINGLYRHGFLLAPAMAKQAADIVRKERRVSRETDCERAGL